MSRCHKIAVMERK